MNVVDKDEAVKFKEEICFITPINFTHKAGDCDK